MAKIKYHFDLIHSFIYLLKTTAKLIFIKNICNTFFRYKFYIIAAIQAGNIPIFNESSFSR